MKVSLFIIPVMYGIIGTYKPCSTPSMLREFLPRCENLDCLGDANVAWILVAFLNGLFQMGLFYIYATVVVFTLVHVVLYPSLMIKLWIGGMDRYAHLKKFAYNFQWGKIVNFNHIVNYINFASELWVVPMSFI